MSKSYINYVLAIAFSFLFYLNPTSLLASSVAVCDNTWREVPNIPVSGMYFQSSYTMVSKYYPAVSGLYPNHISLVAINDNGSPYSTSPQNIREQRCEGGDAVTPCSWLDDWDSHAGLVGYGGPRWTWQIVSSTWQPLGMGSAGSLYLGTYGGIKAIWATTSGGTSGSPTGVVRKSANDNTWYWDSGSYSWNTPAASSAVSDAGGRSFYARRNYTGGYYRTEYKCSAPASGTISSNPTSAYSGDSTLISWSTGGSVASCTVYKYLTYGGVYYAGTIGSGLSGSASSGSLNSAYSPYIFELYCDSGAVDKYVNVPVSLPPPPTADIKLNGGDTNVSVATGGSATASWSSTNSTSCSVTCTSGTCSGPSWQGTSNAGQSTGALTASNTYNLTCTSSSGATASDVLSVNIIPASVGISATPTTVNQGSASTLSWNYSGANSCTITSPGSISNYPASSGSISTGPLASSQTYSISCLPSGGGSFGSVTVSVLVPLSLNVVKLGQGTITSAPAGISCGSTCSTSINLNTSVVLTAVPNVGRRFVGWTVVGGGTCSGLGTCTVLMDSAKTVTANFVVDPNYGEF